LESFSGHSCFFPTSIALSTPKTYLSKQRSSATIDSVIDYSDGILINSSYCINSPNFKMIRRIFLYNDSEIMIEDTGICYQASATEIYKQNILLGDHLKHIENKSDVMIFHGKEYGLAIKNFTAADATLIRGHNGTALSDVNGWRSINWGEILPTYSLTFSQNGIYAKIITCIKIFKIGSVVDTTNWVSFEKLSQNAV
jgi:hypothetical protein